MEITYIILAILIAGIAFLMLRAYMRMKHIKATPESQNIKILTDQNFRNQIKSGVVLVDFWAAWCMPCKLMVPLRSFLKMDRRSIGLSVLNLPIKFENRLKNIYSGRRKRSKDIQSEYFLLFKIV
ncbi:MAG: hypothetical protein JXA23_12485 [Bacteroidales bacterium]|nr:hypothetical protein [Bacteroidales bacterium]